jgi:pyrroline-5-carboxylate reductase
MATALIEGLMRSGWNACDITVIEPDGAQADRVASALGVRVLRAADSSLGRSEIVVWAVKPQVLRLAIAPARSVLKSPLHVSIVAGISTTTLSQWLGSDRVIRVMPNTPALVGSGVTGMLAMSGATKKDRALASRIFSATGHAFWVDSDDRIDAVTAVSGSGPGYIFEFLACFQSAAQLLGFSEDEARELVIRTAAGALKQAADDFSSFATLRNNVASKGGTTEAGLEVLSRHNLPTVMKLAAACAYERARELSRSLDA